MIKQQILEDLKKSIKDLRLGKVDTFLYIPENNQFGDYSSNVALQLAKPKTKKDYHSSLEIAKEILEKFGHPNYLERIEVVEPGFINFFIKRELWEKDVEEILNQGKNFGENSLGKGKKARVEFISANPTGPLHIGNARGGPLGDAICNCLEFSGYSVLREYIHNDVGEQVKKLGETIKAIVSNQALKTGQYQGGYTKELANKLKNQIKHKSEEEIGKLAVDLLFEEIKEDIKKMGIKFDLIVKESDLRKKAPKVVEELKKTGMTKEKDGALWLAPSDEFLKDRETVIVKSDGGYTYFIPDIVYHQQKFQSGASLIIDVFGSNHHGHVPRLQAAVLALGFDVAKLKFILYQYVRVKRGKEIVRMSKRAGNFISAREILDEVGKDAFRYFLLSHNVETHIDFDLDLAKEQSEKNPVYYVQYAHARMFGIQQKGGQVKNKFNTGLLIEEAEVNLIKHLVEFPDLIEGITQDFQVQKLAAYAYNLATLFNSFYEKCPVLYASNENLVASRLKLVEAAKVTLSNVLKLLGVAAPERM